MFVKIINTEFGYWCSNFKREIFEVEITKFSSDITGKLYYKLLDRSQINDKYSDYFFYHNSSVYVDINHCEILSISNTKEKVYFLMLQMGYENNEIIQNKEKE